MSFVLSSVRIIFPSFIIASLEVKYSIYRLRNALLSLLYYRILLFEMELLPFFFLECCPKRFRNGMVLSQDGMFPDLRLMNIILIASSLHGW